MKKIIALAIASAFVAPAVMADVTIYGGLRTALEYGKISDGYDNVSSKPSGTVAGYSKIRLMDESSRIGFKGSEKLDNGLTVSFKTEQRIRVGSHKENGGNTVETESATTLDQGWGEREQSITIAGDSFGQIRIGRFDDIIDASRGDFYDGIGGIEETGGRSSFYVRRGSGKSNNTIAYESKSFNGFNVKAQYVFITTTAAGKSYGYAATSWYENNMFTLGAGMKHMEGTSSKDVRAYDKFTVTDGATYDYAVIGASVMPVKGLTLSIAGDQTKVVKGTGKDETKQTGYGIGAKFKTGKFGYHLNMGKLNDSETAGSKADDGGFNLNAGTSYALSKKTTLVAGFSYLKLDRDNNTQTNTTTFEKSYGAKMMTISAGIKADF